jgi:hypothetical protein
MPFKKTKRKPVRIESEISQARGTPKKARRLDKANEHERKQLNRIFELEQQIAKLSRGDKGIELAFYISSQAREAITTLTKSGFYGTSDAETATQLMMHALRKERFL